MDQDLERLYMGYKKAKLIKNYLPRLLPFAGIIFIIFIVLLIIVAVVGNKETMEYSEFALPFNTTEFTITSPYGDRDDPINKVTATHNGIDVVPSGTISILAIGSGTVIHAGDYGTGGQTVIIEHSLDGQVYQSIYHHLKEKSIKVQVGEPVSQGQEIGLMGSTGRSTGPHLHLGLKKFNIEKQVYEFTDPSFIFEVKNKPQLDLDVFNNKSQINGNKNNNNKDTSSPSLPKIEPNLPAPNYNKN